LVFGSSLQQKEEGGVNLKVEQLEVPKEKYESELVAFKTLIKENRQTVIQQVHKDLHKIYGHLQHGGKVIELAYAFKKGRLNSNKNPKLAICRADAKTCYLVKHDDGSAVFSCEAFNDNARNNTFNGRVSLIDVSVPSGTFKFPDFSWQSREQFVQTSVPVIPTSILAPIQDKLEAYHILWEVEEWVHSKTPRPPRDPILVSLVNNNIALVLATWDLTELERAVIRGRIQ